MNVGFEHSLYSTFCRYYNDTVVGVLNVRILSFFFDKTGSCNSKTRESERTKKGQNCIITNAKHRLQSASKEKNACNANLLFAGRA
jgi:hypothetical protein